MFDHIGNVDILNELKSKYKNNNLHSSIIVYGPKGIGKRNFIDNLIKDLFKITFMDKNYLHHLNLIKNNSHPNIKLIQKEIDTKTKKLKSNITIDQIRNIKKFIKNTSSINDITKFIIIDSADDLNANSANSLLKSLEEPSNKTTIFLISHQLSSLLPTIRSRCVKIKLNILSYEDFKTVLLNNIEFIDDEEIKFYFDLTLGAPGSALSLHNDNIIDLFDLTIKSLNDFDKSSIELSNYLLNYENDKFKDYLLILKSILLNFYKIKIKDYKSESFLSKKFKLLEKNLSKISINSIIKRFDFLSSYEKDLFTYNLDKKSFILKFLTSE